MFNDPKIISTNDLSTKAYITFYFNGTRFREYSGRKLGIDISPNRANSIREREKLLKKLLFEFQKSFEKGWNPNEAESEELKTSTQDILQEVLNEKTSGSFSATYKRDLSRVHSQFIEFLTDREKQGALSKLTSKRINDFLNQFDSTGTHYMNKRRNLSVLLSSAMKKGYIEVNPIEKTNRRKVKASLHQIYSSTQIKKILKFVKADYPNLHLCCLLTYGCLLRPHQETRLLKKAHFNSDFTKITLAGNENKSCRIRTVHIPGYVREELIKRDIQNLTSTQNIISGDDKPFNESYFSLQWSRAKKKMVEKGLLQENQTIYSFRHSAAVSVYRKTKDIHILQQLLGHSNMMVTLKYLRGLGELNSDELKQYLPEL